MLLRRSSVTLRLVGLIAMIVLLIGAVPRFVARGEPKRNEAGSIFAEPLPPEAFEPTISAVAAFLPLIANLSTPAAPASRAGDLPQSPGVLTVQRRPGAPGEDQAWALTIVYPDAQAHDFAISIPERITIEQSDAESFALTVSGRDVPGGETRSATVLLTADSALADLAASAGDPLTIPVSFIRAPGVVEVASSCEPSSIARDSETVCSVTLTNTGTTAAAVLLITALPHQLGLVEGSVTGGTPIGRKGVIYKGSLPGPVRSGVSATVDPAAAPAGYVPLRLLGIPPIGGVGDETLTNVTVPAFSFGGNRYERIGIVSNGYIVLGGGDARDISPVNTSLPDPGQPNGTVAPFWSNLNPGAGGAVRIAIVNDNGTRWVVVDYDAVPNASSLAEVNSFQVWISLDTPDKIGFVYGPTLTTGDRGRLTVGAEDANGTTGATIYYNGSGVAPAPSAPIGNFAVGISATAAQSATHTLRFTAQGRRVGAYTGYSVVFSDAFDGAAVSKFTGEVVDH